jgi:hypothetical protein
MMAWASTVTTRLHSTCNKNNVVNICTLQATTTSSYKKQRAGQGPPHVHPDPSLSPPNYLGQMLHLLEEAYLR